LWWLAIAFWLVIMDDASFTAVVVRDSRFSMPVERLTSP
jgi:hypothetical protein